MSQDKAHPTPPAVPSEREAFEAWYGARRGTGLLGKIATGRYEWDATQDAWLAFQAGRATAPSLAAPVASNTTAEPAPIQPAGVEVESLPKLPRPAVHAWADISEHFLREHHYTAEQMRAYALQAIRAAASQGDRGKT